MDSTFFATGADFHAWLEAHHDTAQELWVGFYKKSSGKLSITCLEVMDAALCHGWDRWRAQERGRCQLCRSLHTTQTAQHLERGQRQTGHGACQPGPDAPAGPQSVREPPGSKERNLCVRARECRPA